MYLLNMDNLGEVYGAPGAGYMSLKSYARLNPEVKYTLKTNCDNSTK